MDAEWREEFERYGRLRWTKGNQTALYPFYFAPLYDSVDYLNWIHSEYCWEQAYMDQYGDDEGVQYSS